VAGRTPTRVHDGPAQDVTGQSGVPALRRARRPGATERVPAPRALRTDAIGYTLDLMRHDPDAPNGITEFLIAHGARAARSASTAVDELRGVGSSARRRRAAHARPDLRAWAIRKLNPVLPDRVAAHVQREVLPEWLPRQHRVRRRRRPAATRPPLTPSIEGSSPCPCCGTSSCPSRWAVCTHPTKASGCRGDLHVGGVTAAARSWSAMGGDSSIRVRRAPRSPTSRSAISNG
jgi:hypothetical protein